jgi:hypothetical protein
VLLEETLALAQKAGAVHPEVNTSVAAHFFFFGVGDCMEFYGDPHSTRPAEERLPRAIVEQVMDVMRYGIMGDRK